MDLTQLRGKLEELAESMSGEQKRILAARLSGLASVFPFSEYEYMLMFLLDKQVIKFDQYEKLRADYVATNRYLELFGLSPRVFGEIWAHGHIRDLSSKALSKDSAGPFWMNFQQIKPDAAQVFVFIGVWVDSIVYWVLSRAEIRENPYLSHQHRGGIEYQVGVTEKNIGEFDKFRVEPARLAQAVIAKASRLEK